MKKHHAILSVFLLIAVILSAGPALASEMKTYDIPPIPFSEVSVPPATVIAQEGNLTAEGQKDVHTYTVPRNGLYRIEMNELYGGAKVDLKIFNRLGEKVESYTNCGNGNGIAMNWKEGETYEIRVEQASGLSSYILNIGEPKPVLDLAELTQVTDSVEFTAQRNVYSFVIPADGLYRLELSEMMADLRLSIRVYNHLGETIDHCTNAGNGAGVTLGKMKAGEACTIAVTQEIGTGSYILSVGKQKAPFIFSGPALIRDSIEYTDQNNIYGFTAEKDGKVTVSLGEVHAGCNLNIVLRNHLGESLDHCTNAKNGASMTVDRIEAGKYYEIHLSYANGFFPYELTITQ